MFSQVSSLFVADREFELYVFQFHCLCFDSAACMCCSLFCHTLLPREGTISHRQKKHAHLRYEQVNKLHSCVAKVICL